MCIIDLVLRNSNHRLFTTSSIDIWNLLSSIYKFHPQEKSYYDIIVCEYAAGFLVTAATLWVIPPTYGVLVSYWYRNVIHDSLWHGDTIPLSLTLTECWITVECPWESFQLYIRWKLLLFLRTGTNCSILPIAYCPLIVRLKIKRAFCLNPSIKGHRMSVFKTPPSQSLSSLHTPTKF